MFIKVLATLWIMPAQYQLPLNAIVYVSWAWWENLLPIQLWCTESGLKLITEGALASIVGDGNENGEKEIALDLQNNGCHLQKKIRKIWLES